MTDPLVIIASGSLAAARTAADAIRAREVGSPMAGARAARAARIALDDPQATFTEQERRVIVELLETERSDVLRLRVTPAEKAEVQRMAEDAGLTVSDFIRRRIGLEY
jgi:16S rRNA U516 pseudouridylate synthase RsuA-like enzyme